MICNNAQGKKFILKFVTQDHVQSHGVTGSCIRSHKVTRESVKVVKFEVINQFWIVHFHCYSSPSIIRTSIIQSETFDYPSYSEATFYYEYHYNLEYLVACSCFTVGALTSCYLLLFSIEECFSVQ